MFRFCFVRDKRQGDRQYAGEAHLAAFGTSDVLIILSCHTGCAGILHYTGVTPGAGSNLYKVHSSDYDEHTALLRGHNPVMKKEVGGARRMRESSEVHFGENRGTNLGVCAREESLPIADARWDPTTQQQSDK